MIIVNGVLQNEARLESTEKIQTYISKCDVCRHVKTRKSEMWIKIKKNTAVTTLSELNILLFLMKIH